MLEVETLTDGGQAATDIAKQAAAFIDGATRTLDLAMYDLRLDGEADTIVHSALTNAKARGVAVRIASRARTTPGMFSLTEALRHRWAKRGEIRPVTPRPRQRDQSIRRTLTCVDSRVMARSRCASA